MAKEVIIIPTRPKTPYSPGIRAGDYIFISGQTGLVDKQGKELKDFESQARQCFENIKEVLEKAGSSLSEVVKVTIFLTKAEQFDKMNEIFLSFFSKDLPARSTVATTLVRPNMLIEAECIAYNEKHLRYL